MSNYTLTVRIPQAGNKEIQYSLDLTGLYESYPEDYFRRSENRDLVRAKLQSDSAREISQSNLDSMIAKWIADIKCGLHNTVFTADLPPTSNMRSSPINSTPAASPPNQVLNYPQPKKPQRTDTQNPPPIASPPMGAPPSPTKVVSDVRVDTNKADF
jgi:hypothetical protein